MKKENKEYLEAHREVLDEINNAQTAKKARAIAMTLHRILTEEFVPGYAFTDDCNSCLFNMVPLLYKKFDEWKAANPEPLIVKASFPDNKPDGIELFEQMVKPKENYDIVKSHTKHHPRRR